MAVAPISTLYVTGFALNASDREMENFCRFLPGFVGAKSSLTHNAPKVWVRFDSTDSAIAAMPFLDGQPFDMQDNSSLLRASMAKTDMNPDAWDRKEARPRGAACIAGPLDELLGLGQPSERPPLAAPWGQSAKHSPWQSNSAWEPAQPGAQPRGKGGGKQPPNGGKGGGKMPAGSAQNDTLAILGMVDKGVTEDILLQFFSQLDGFVTLTVATGRSGEQNCFVKFGSRPLAQFALESAAEAGVHAEPAKNSLDIGKLQGAHGAARQATPEGLQGDDGAEEEQRWTSAEGGPWTPQNVRPPKRPRYEEARSETGKGPGKRDVAEAASDTLVLTSIGSVGMTEASCEEFFAQIDGFVASNFNTTGRGGGNYFVKYAGAELAAAALRAANDAGLQPQWARKSLEPEKLQPQQTS